MSATALKFTWKFYFLNKAIRIQLQHRMFTVKYLSRFFEKCAKHLFLFFYFKDLLNTPELNAKTWYPRLVQICKILFSDKIKLEDNDLYVEINIYSRCMRDVTATNWLTYWCICMSLVQLYSMHTFNPLSVLQIFSCMFNNS